MPRKIYTAAYRSHLVSLVQQGRTPESLAKEFEPSAPAIRQWVEADAAASREEAPVDKDARIRELERLVGALKEEQEILKKAAAWFASESESGPRAGTRS